MKHAQLYEVVDLLEDIRCFTWLESRQSPAIIRFEILMGFVALHW